MPWELTDYEIFATPDPTRVGMRLSFQQRDEKGVLAGEVRTWEHDKFGMDVGVNPEPHVAAFAKVRLDQMNTPPADLRLGRGDASAIMAMIEAQKPVEPTPEEVAEAAKQAEVRDALRAANRAMRLKQLLTEDEEVARLYGERPDLVEQMIG